MREIEREGGGRDIKKLRKIEENGDNIIYQVVAE